MCSFEIVESKFKCRLLDLSHVMSGVPDLYSRSTRDESAVEHTMYNVFNKTICVCCYMNSSSGLQFTMRGGHADPDLKAQKFPCVKHGNVLGKYSHVINMGLV